MGEIIGSICMGLFAFLVLSACWSSWDGTSRERGNFFECLFEYWGGLWHSRSFRNRDVFRNPLRAYITNKRQPGSYSDNINQHDNHPALILRERAEAVVKRLRVEGETTHRVIATGQHLAALEVYLKATESAREELRSLVRRDY
jgi:hypothetical protein